MKNSLDNIPQPGGSRSGFSWSARLLILSLVVVASGAQATEYPPTSAASSSQISPTWVTGYGIDGNTSTVWSSVTHGSSNNSEWYAYWFGSFQNVNYVRLQPRWNGTTALGFPVTFTINYSNGPQWVTVRTVTSMQTPYDGNDIILVLPGTYNCNGIQIVATVLGQDDRGDYVFQMADFHAGYDSAYTSFQWIGNNGSANRAEVHNVGSRAFNPNKIANWVYDDRTPMISPQSGTYRNIYAPNIVNNGGAWNIYFGGWDGSSTQNDKVSITVSTDLFGTFGTHVLEISNGVFQHLNNETAVKISNTDWRMAYTTYNGSRNKPGYATSSDGASWTPNSGSTSYLMSMSGYPNWANADVNGGNAIYYENGTFHMYFDDTQSPGIYYATSTDNIHYTYHGQKTTSTNVPQDLKHFVYNSVNYYLWGFHEPNGPNVYYSLGTDVTNPPTPATLFSNTGSADQYIVGMGYVSDGSRLYGALYGASSTTSLDTNRIFARWLQRKVLFNGTRTLGIGGHAYGPNIFYTYFVSGFNTEYGVFNLYDEDGTTLTFTSPHVTFLSGDIWQCNL